MAEYHVGDCVQIKTWEELVEEFGLDRNSGDIENVPLGFSSKMRYMCGKVVHISQIKENPSEPWIHTEEQIEYPAQYGEKALDWRPYWMIGFSFIKPYNDEDLDSEPVSESEWRSLLGGMV